MPKELRLWLLKKITKRRHPEISKLGTDIYTLPPSYQLNTAYSFVHGHVRPQLTAVLVSICYIKLDSKTSSDRNNCNRTVDPGQSTACD